jgi:hypothetical protein
LRISWRWIMRGILLVVAIGLLWFRFAAHRTKSPVASGPGVPDVSSHGDLNRPGGGPAAADAYPVYSALYQQPMQEPLAIADHSVTDIPQVGGSCLKPTTADERQMSNAFTAANRQSHTWEQKFSIPGNYQLLTPAQAAQAESCLEHHDERSSACAPWKNLRHIRFLGAPGFNPAHTRALVSVIRMCGGFCGSGGIFAVEKEGETWKRAETTDFTRDCSWMY